MKPLELHKIPGQNVWWEATADALAYLSRDYIARASRFFAERVPVEKYQPWPFEGLDDDPVEALVSDSQKLKIAVVPLQDTTAGGRLVLHWRIQQVYARDGQNRLAACRRALGIS